MTRIVGGALGGRRLVVPPGRDVRPTSDRAREALFDTLGSMLDLDGSRVLDLYAGSGAVGLEALSRGAAHALLVEADQRAVTAIRSNAAALGLAERAQVVRDRVDRLLAAAPPTPPPGAPPTAPPGASPAGSPAAEPPARAPYHLVFADPPYVLPDAEVNAVLAALVAHGWLAADAVVVVERSSRGAGPAWPASLKPEKQRRYGDGTLWYGRRT
jgi:16S rRNA G966 N2-methylase RsmD